MASFDDKTQTFEFDAVIEEKPQQNRSAGDEYSAARRSKPYEAPQKKEKGNGGLIAVAIILAILLVAVIIVGIFLLKADKNPLVKDPNPPITENLPEEEIPEESIILECSMVFYPDSIMRKNGEYTVLADLYDDGFYKFDNRKLIINDETQIRESGKRLSAQALAYLVENSGGDSIVFDGEIRDEDGVILTLTFETPVEEEIPEDEIEIIEPEAAEEGMTDDITIGEVIE